MLPLGAHARQRCFMWRLTVQRERRGVPPRGGLGGTETTFFYSQMGQLGPRAGERFPRLYKKLLNG